MAALHLYRSGTIQINRPAADRYAITGIDVSHHQGVIDWAAVASSGVEFAFVKATEGRDLTDQRFAYNVQGAQAAGLAVGPYHFFTFCTPGSEQAHHFLATAPPSHESLPPVVDVEFMGNCKSWNDAASVRQELGHFLTLVEEAWEVKPILYVTQDALKRIIADQFHGHPIWIRSVFTEPALDAHRNWKIWQFSENSRIPGILGPVDRNALRPGISLNDLRMPVSPPATEATGRGRTSRKSSGRSISSVTVSDTNVCEHHRHDAAISSTHSRVETESALGWLAGRCGAHTWSAAT